MNSFRFTVLFCLITHLVLGGPFAYYLNPITKQANRIDFGAKSLQILVDSKHWVEAGAISIDSFALSEIRRDADFKTIATNSPNQYTLFQECTNQVFSFDLSSRKISRLDSTYFRGDNCGSIVFLRNNQYYQIGGYGFWKGNNHITYFDSKLKEWEGVEVGGQVPNSIYRGYTAYLPDEDKIISFSNYSNDISRDFGSLKLTNDIHEFSFKTKTWSKLGEVSHPYMKDVLSKIAIDRRERVIFTGKYFAIFPLGTSGHVTIIFIDPRNLGIYEYQDSDLKYARFPFYNLLNSNPTTFTHKQWLLGTVHNNAAHLSNSSQLIDLNNIAQNAKFIGYLTDKPWFLSNWFFGVVGAIFLAILYVAFRTLYAKRKQNITISPVTHTSHFDELQLSLLTHFYQHSAHEGLDVEQVNDILGINLLGADTQRFRRSLIIKELNSKLAFLTGEKNSILRVSSQLDKRQKRYQLHDNVKDFVKKELSL